MCFLKELYFDEFGVYDTRYTRCLHKIEIINLHIKDMNIQIFTKSFWNYYLELEARMGETRRYVEYDEINFKTYSSNYLMLFQTVCSEIDVVGKEIATYFNPSFETDEGNKPINRWWFEIQDNMPNINREVIFADSYTLKPWDKYRVVKVESKQLRNQKQIDVVKYNLQPKGDGITYATPKWWNAYNKVKHKRLKIDSDGVNYKKANLQNLSLALAALYLMEFEFMKNIGTVKERLKCGKSELFGMGDLQGSYISSVHAEGGTLIFQ